MTFCCCQSIRSWVASTPHYPPLHLYFSHLYSFFRSLSTNILRSAVFFHLSQKFSVKYTVNGDLAVEGARKASMVNFSKVIASSNGSFEFEAELNDAIADCTLGMKGKVGSAAWNAKVDKDPTSKTYGEKINHEEVTLTLGFGTGDLGFSMDTNILGGSADLDVSYAYDSFLFGGSATLGLPFALVGDAGKFGVKKSAVGVSHTSGDITVGLNLGGVHKGFKTANMDLAVFHKCSADTTWGATVSSATIAPSKIKAKLAVESKLDGQTTFGFGVSHKGLVTAKYAQDVSSKVQMTYQVAVDVNNLANDQKFGIGITMNA